MYTDRETFKNAVIEFSQRYDTDLSYRYFHMQVDMPVYDILNVYAELERELDGNNIMCLDEPKLTDPNTIEGRMMSLTEFLQNKMYHGRASDILSALGNANDVTGLYRLSDIKPGKTDDYVIGTILPFI